MIELQNFLLATRKLEPPLAAYRSGQVPPFLPCFLPAWECGRVFPLPGPGKLLLRGHVDAQTAADSGHSNWPVTFCGRHYQVKQSQVGITLLVLLFGRKLGLLELLGLCFPGPEAVFGRPG